VTFDGAAGYWPAGVTFDGAAGYWPAGVTFDGAAGYWPAGVTADGPWLDGVDFEGPCGAGKVFPGICGDCALAEPAKPKLSSAAEVVPIKRLNVIDAFSISRRGLALQPSN
jgi:hypothetical protein